MKKIVVRLSFVIASLCAFASLGAAENLIAQVPVPFPFSAAGRSMPAGEYTISRLTENTSVLLIEEASSGAKTLVMARPVPTAMKEKPTASLVFATTASSRMLSGVETPGRTFEVSVVSEGADALRQVNRPVTAGKAVAAF